MAWKRWLMVAVAMLALRGEADVRGCACDISRPETMAARECSLCRAIESLPASPAFQVIRDASPNKPNRWLAVPRFHGGNPQVLAELTARERTAYWTAAIGKAHELWGEDWGLAVNSLSSRTQCHLHIHIGKLRGGAEDNRYDTVSDPSAIPLPRENEGIWVHPSRGKLHVHYGDESPELRLER